MTSATWICALTLLSMAMGVLTSFSGQGGEGLICRGGPPNVPICISMRESITDALQPPPLSKIWIMNDIGPRPLTRGDSGISRAYL